MKIHIEQGALLALLGLCSACGGNVNLGSRDQEGAPMPDDPPRAVPDAPAAASPNDPYLVTSERTLELGEIQPLGPLAVAGDFLYLAGYRGAGEMGLFRCRTSSCPSTFQRLPGVNDNLSFLQAAGERLAVASVEPDRWLGSFALPDARDRQVALEPLPMLENITPYFYGGFVYWTMLLDSAYYRCALPTCAGGPRKLLDTRGVGSATGDGTQIFATLDGQIVRLTQLGEGPVERLLPDATLSAAPPLAQDSQPDPTSDYVSHVVAGAGTLYAAINLNGCVSCPGLIARWPTSGGPREDVFRPEGNVGEMFVFGQELVWVAVHQDLQRADLATCRVEACSATLRHLDVVDASFHSVAADEERIYWLENQRVRSVGLLPKP
jgi:hypothetical protein